MQPRSASPGQRETSASLERRFMARKAEKHEHELVCHEAVFA